MLAGSLGAQEPARPAAATAQHQDSTHHRAARHAQRKTAETQAELQREAKISMDSAKAVAAKTVPAGVIQSSELEREHGKLIYSFDMKVAGKAGVEEVNVDALTGALVAHEHESAKAERAEKAREAKEKPASKPSVKP